MLLCGSAVAGLIGGIVAITCVDGARGSYAVFLLVAFGTIVVSLFQLQVGSLAAIGRASWVIGLNTSANLLRIALLIGLSIVLPWHFLEMSSVLSSAAVCLVVVPIVTRIVRSPEGFVEVGSLSNTDALREFTRFTKPAFVAVFMGSAVFWLTPFLVLVASDSVQAALYALSIPLAQFLDLMTAAMATSLVVHASAEPGKATQMARSMLLRCGALAVAGAAAITFVAPLVLSQLNPEYASMNTIGVVGMLCVASVLRVPFATWAALQRSRRNLGPVLAVTCVGATVAVTGVVLLSHLYGALGGAGGVAVAYCVMSVGAGLHTVRSRRSIRSVRGGAE